MITKSKLRWFSDMRKLIETQVRRVIQIKRNEGKHKEKPLNKELPLNGLYKTLS